MLAMAASPPAARAAIPSGYQSYYVLGDSSTIVEDAMDPATGFDADTSEPWSMFSIVSYLDTARVYIDQKYNGYTFNPSTFSGADAVFEIAKGSVLTTDNWAAPYYRIDPPGSGALISGSLQGVDGGDFFYTAGGPVSAVRGVTDRQPGTGPLGNYITEIWSVFPVEHGGADAQKSYIIPVGENTPITGDFDGGLGEENPGGTYAVVQATADDTQVNYTRRGTPMTQSLDRGDSFVITHVWHGDTIVADKKIQVVLLASGGESYDFRAFSLASDVLEGSNFYIPTFPTDNDDSASMPVRYHIYAITEANVTIETNLGTAPGWNPRHIAAGSVDVTYTTNGQKMTHIHTRPGQKIMILVSIDTNSGERDWGYVPIDSSYYVSDYFTAYAPGGLAHLKDMQIYVTPNNDHTQIHADYDRDGVWDETIVLDRMQSHGFYNPAAMDMTGTHLSGNNTFTTVYGESIFADSGGTLAGYDWGYTLIPLDAANFDASLTVEKTADPADIPVGSTVKFTATVTAGNWTVTDVNVTDTLPPGFTYIPGSTNVTHPDLSMTHEEPGVGNPTLTWLLGEDLTPGEVLVVAFMAEAPLAAGRFENHVAAHGRDPGGNPLEPEDTAPVSVFEAGIVSGTITDVTGPAPVPNITVWLLNTLDATLNTTETDALGRYKFTGLPAGTYHVRYDSADPDMGALIPFSDDDPAQPADEPLTCSANFTIPAAGSHVHDFEVTSPVDLAIAKTGPLFAKTGDEITYGYAVTNLGATAAGNVTVSDDVCGLPTHLSGDANNDTLLQPGETWLYACNYTVQPGDGPMLNNTATVATTSPDTDPSNNASNWTVTIYSLDLRVEKTLTAPIDGPAGPGDAVTFNITVTNLSTVPLLTVPLTDQYDPFFLNYTSAAPPPDSADEATGTLAWSDLTGPGDLAPGDSLSVQITFTALDEEGAAINAATVEDASAGAFGTVSGSDDAQVTIATPVGGDVTAPDTVGIKAAILTALLAVAVATVALRRR